MPSAPRSKIEAGLSAVAAQPSYALTSFAGPSPLRSEGRHGRPGSRALARKRACRCAGPAGGNGASDRGPPIAGRTKRVRYGGAILSRAPRLNLFFDLPADAGPTNAGGEDFGYFSPPAGNRLRSIVPWNPSGETGASRVPGMPQGPNLRFDCRCRYRPFPSVLFQTTGGEESCCIATVKAGGFDSRPAARKRRRSSAAEHHRLARGSTGLDRSPVSHPFARKGEGGGEDVCYFVARRGKRHAGSSPAGRKADRPQGQQQHRPFPANPLPVVKSSDTSGRGRRGETCAPCVRKHRLGRRPFPGALSHAIRGEDCCYFVC